MTTLHLVPHTHWDREWYQSFQSFRIRLVHLMDLLLDILDRDPSFLHFTLDGQTIVLDDYLAIRPEREEELRRHVVSGRILIGPWHILPDEFLVSPEATVRNLLRGTETCRRFGRRMDVGYIPDPFGHIGQMPQILRGFGIETAAFRRGLDDEPCELWWEAPDGSRVLTSYLRDGYDNAARLPTAPLAFRQFIADRRSSLVPHSAVSHLLFLNGTDHQEPQPEVPTLISQTDLEGDRLVLSTLPDYLAGVRQEVESRRLTLPVVRGETRSPKRHHLLPGVLSSRAWIKQRNHACEALLERWAEPFGAWAELVAGERPDRTVWTGHLTTPRVRQPAALAREAWRLLMECHPHDSICGCSIDPVHEQMRSRFDQVEEIGEEVARQSVAALAEAVDTASELPTGSRAAMVVFNPEQGPRTDLATARFELAAGLDTFEIVDDEGHLVPHRLLDRRSRPLADMELDRDGVRGLPALAPGGVVLGLAIQEAAVVRHPDHVLIDVSLAENAEPNQAALEAASSEIERILADKGMARFRLLAHLTTEVEIEVLARDVPAHGYRRFLLRPAAIPAPASPSAPAAVLFSPSAPAAVLSSPSAPAAVLSSPSAPAAVLASPSAPAAVLGGRVPDGGAIENEWLRVETAGDGGLTLTDLRSGQVFSGVLRFCDQADRGDSYTFCPLEGDVPVDRPVEPPRGRRITDVLGEALEIQQVYCLPRRLTAERTRRSPENVEMPIITRLSLCPGVPRLDVEIRLENQAEDHRLQVLFSLGVAVDQAAYDGAFEIVRRPTKLPSGTEGWIEQPAAEVPMRCFVAAAAKGKGMLVANRGLREASVSPDGVMAVTLLRCFGWLSRDDLATRKGGAGPKVVTPGGQELGSHTFHLSLIPFAHDLDEAVVEAYAFQSPMRAIGTRLHRGILPPAASLLAWTPGSFHLTCVKTAEDGQGLIVRGVNLRDERAEVELECLLAVAEACRARLDETPLEALPVEAGCKVRFAARPHEIVTLRVRLGRTPG